MPTPSTLTITINNPKPHHHEDFTPNNKQGQKQPPAPPARPARSLHAPRCPPPHLVLKVDGRARLDEPIRHLHVALRQRHVERSVAIQPSQSRVKRSPAILRSPEGAGRTATSAHAPRQHVRTHSRTSVFVLSASLVLVLVFVIVLVSARMSFGGGLRHSIGSSSISSALPFDKHQPIPLT